MIAAVAVLVDLAVELGGVVAAVSEALLQVGPVGGDLSGAAIAGRGDQHLEIGGQVAADGLAVQSEPAGDGADRPRRLS